VADPRTRHRLAPSPVRWTLGSACRQDRSTDPDGAAAMLIDLLGVGGSTAAPGGRVVR
jgi:hypothetical protein